MSYGIVYLLTNPCMPGLVKIGMTTQEDIEKRMKELYTTGVPVPFECQFACEVNKKDCAKIEKALHTAFEPQRINKNREFFKINVEQARAILELFHHTDVTEEITTLVKEIIEGKKRTGADTTFLESKIDNLVYQLYGLTDEEIKIVEQS